MPLRRLALCCVLGLAAPAFAGEGIAVVGEGGIRDKWMLKEGVPLVAPAYPPAFAARKDQVCVSLGYLLNADGTTSDFTLLQGWNSASGNNEPAPDYWKTFAGAAAEALARWQFQPRPEVTTPQPVFTAGTFAFGPGGGAAARDHCKLPQLESRLRQLRATAGNKAPPILARLDLGKATADEARREQARLDYER